MQQEKHEKHETHEKPVTVAQKQEKSNHPPSQMQGPRHLARGVVAFFVFVQQSQVFMFFMFFMFFLLHFLPGSWKQEKQEKDVTVPQQKQENVKKAVTVAHKARTQAFG